MSAIETFYRQLGKWLCWWNVWRPRYALPVPTTSGL